MTLVGTLKISNNHLICFAVERVIVLNMKNTI